MSRPTHAAGRSGRALGRYAQFCVAGFIGVSLLSMGLPAEAAEEGPPVAVAESDRDDDSEADWMPSLALSYGAYSQSISGNTTSSSSQIRGRPGDSLITQFFQFEGQVYTPLKLDDIVTKPRLFLSAGVQIPLAEGLIAERVDESYDRGSTQFAQVCPNNLPGPSPPPVTNPNLLSDTCALTIRNKVTLEAMWYLGFGVDFTLPIDKDQFHISPAVEYYGYAVETVGEVTRATSGTAVDDLVEQSKVTGNAKVYHGISSSLTTSVDVFEQGGWRWSMFVQGRVVFLLNDPYTSASTSLDSTDFTFVSGLDDFIAQGTGGFRVQWTGKRGRR